MVNGAKPLLGGAALPRTRWARQHTSLQAPHWSQQPRGRQDLPRRLLGWHLSRNPKSLSTEGTPGSTSSACEVKRAAGCTTFTSRYPHPHEQQRLLRGGWDHPSGTPARPPRQPPNEPLRKDGAPAQPHRPSRRAVGGGLGSACPAPPQAPGPTGERPEASSAWGGGDSGGHGGAPSPGAHVLGESAR